METIKEDLYTKFLEEAKNMHQKDVLDHIYAMLKADSYMKLIDKRN